MSCLKTFITTYNVAFDAFSVYYFTLHFMTMLKTEARRIIS